MTDCRYCGSAVEEHGAVYVSEGEPDGEPLPFCNYACLTAHIDAENLVTNASCNWSPEA